MTTCTCDTFTSSTSSAACNVSNTGGGYALSVSTTNNSTGIYCNSSGGTSAPTIWGDGGWVGIYGKTYNGSSSGARGESTSTSGGHGVFGCSAATTATGHGVYGYSSATNLTYTCAGVYGYGNVGVFGSSGQATNGGIGVYALCPQYACGLYAVCDNGLSRGGDAGHFLGDVAVSGYLYKGGGGYRIDHPADPENQILNHCFVESPEMMNIYRGRVVLDANGEAVVSLPDYFSAANEGVEYNLTAVGAAMPNLHVSTELSGNSFGLSGGVAGKTVSWQVTAARADKWAKQNHPGVEIAKTNAEKGKFMHPHLFGKDPSFHMDERVRQTFQAQPTAIPASKP